MTSCVSLLVCYSVYANVRYVCYLVVTVSRLYFKVKRFCHVLKRFVFISPLFVKIFNVKKISSKFSFCLCLKWRSSSRAYIAADAFLFGENIGVIRFLAGSRQVVVIKIPSVVCRRLSVTGITIPHSSAPTNKYSLVTRACVSPGT